MEGPGSRQFCVHPCIGAHRYYSTMTSLVSWIGVDGRSQASIYIVSDSRVCWGSPQIKWDHGRKVFACKAYPEIFGYFGDVLFPSQALAYLVDLIDSRLLFSEHAHPDTKTELILRTLSETFSGYPKEDQLQRQAINILYCTREGEGMTCRFHATLLNCVKSTKWTAKVLAVPRTSGLIANFGSGREVVKDWHTRWSKTSEGGTSRAVFSAVCDSISEGANESMGGAPQLVGLFRKGQGISFGVIFNNHLYYQGTELRSSDLLDNIQWRNQLFELCSWRTRRRLPHAQKHVRPAELKY